MTETELHAQARAGSKDPEVYRELAYRALMVHRADQAGQELQMALQLDPYNAENLNLKGMILAEKGEFGPAIEALRQATQLDTKAVEPYLNLGSLALRRGSLWLASSSLEKAVQLAPKEAEAHMLLGLTLKRRSFSAQAKGHLRKALELRPNYPEAHAALGEVYTDFGQPLEARAELEKAIALGDDRPNTRAYLGLAYATMPVKPTDADTAIKHLRHAEGIGARGPQVYYGLGLAYTSKRDFKNAEKAYKAGLEVAPGSEAMRYGLARIYLQTNRTAEGEKMLKIYQELIRRRQVRESLKNRADSQPDRLELRVAYANMLMEQGDFEEATGEVVKALKQKPNDPKLYDLLALASQKAGHAESAAEARRRATALRGQAAAEGKRL